MYSDNDIMQFIHIIIEVTNPDRIILFGSYAYGEPDEKSDLDILVIKNGKDISRDEHAELSTAVWLKRKRHMIRARYDIFFCNDRQVQESAGNGGAFADALQKGWVVYERAGQ